jgi:Tfp pilus assembly protein PilP
MNRGNHNPMMATWLCMVALILGISGCNPFAGGEGTGASDESGQADASTGAADKKAESGQESDPESGQDDQTAEAPEAEETDGDQESDAQDDGEAQRAPALPSLDEDETAEDEPARRNPFAPQIEVSEASQQDEQEEAEPEDARPPLQRYQLGSLRLTAIISEVSVPKAMFIDPSGTGRMAKEGDRIGTEGGRIEDIRANAVVITLPTGGEEGSRRQRVVELREATMGLGQQRGLDPEEQKILDELMQSEQGRQALQESYQQMESGNRPADAGQRAPRRRQQNTTQGSGTNDERFPGLAPPSE